jgi:chorismate mutase/prephenate dehydratase
MFSIKDRVGALHDILVPFKKRRINLTKIESRPTKKKAWEYVFFIDFEGHIEDKKVKEALGELEEFCVFVRVLGSYPKAD